jgi:serine/threonine-protein kinase
VDELKNNADSGGDSKPFAPLTPPDSIHLVSETPPESTGEESQDTGIERIPDGEENSPQTSATPAWDPLIGNTVGDRYRLQSLLGQGATSSVYKAEDLKLGKEVAVKVLHHHLVSDVEIVRRFKQEVKTVSVLRHPNVVNVSDSAMTRTGQPCLVMDYIEGRTVQELIKENGWLDYKRAAAIFMQVCAALSVAHERGIIHRDLKPSNIMISNDGKDFATVLDFGIAKVLPVQGETFQRLTQSGEMMGSLLYMSPEQCLDQELDCRSDVYSLGCALYETVTGKPPLIGRTAFETINKQLTEVPEKLHRVRPDLVIPEALETIIAKAIAKNPAQRYQSILQLQDDLAKVVKGETVQPSDHTQAEVDFHARTMEALIERVNKGQSAKPDQSQGARVTEAQIKPSKQTQGEIGVRDIRFWLIGLSLVTILPAVLLSSVQLALAALGIMVWFMVNGNKVDLRFFAALGLAIAGMTNPSLAPASAILFITLMCLPLLIGDHK